MIEQSFPLPASFEGDPTRAFHPRQLIVYEDNTGDWNASTEESLLAKIPYLAVSYRQSDFPDRDELEKIVRNICENQGLDAYWLDFACIGQSQEDKNVDLYRIADVFRGATVTLIMIKGQDNKPKSDGWLSWGWRLWTIPEALLSRKIICKVGTRKLEEMDLKKVANHAYENMSREAILIDIYATAGKDFARFSDRFEALCLAIWSRLSGSQISIQHSSEFTVYPGERVYALMGFLGRRIIPNSNESEEQAFRRLLDANKLECDHFPWDKPEQPGGDVRLGIRDKRSSSYTSRKPQRRATVNIEEKDSVLPHVIEARFDYGGSVRVVCQKDTRVATLEAIYAWLGLDKPASGTSQAHTPRNSSNDKTLFWIHGIAGSGKSTIAYTVAKRCFLEKILGASFFCSRDIADCSNIKYIISTLCYQLCQFNASFKDRAYKILRGDREIYRTSLENQLQRLIVEPLQAIADFPPCIVIIDALDECKDDNSTSVILQALDEHLSKLSKLKILITSRPELNIEGAFRTLSLGGETEDLDLNKAGTRQTDKDIVAFLKVRLASIARARGISKPWPSQEELEMLAGRSKGLFMFASTTVKFLEDKSVSDLDGQLKQLLSTTSPDSDSSPYKYLDSLYLQVFRTALPEIKDTLKNRLQAILGTLVLSNRLLSVAAVGSLVRLSPDAVRQTLCNLHSLIVVPEYDRDAIRLIHPSIHDFLTNDNRCTDSRFVVRPADQHSLIVRHCLQKLLHFASENDLAKRYLQEPSLSMHSDWWDCLDHGEDPALTYAFGFWNFHIDKSKLDDATLDTLQEFVSSQPTLDLLIQNNNKAIMAFLNCIERSLKWPTPPYALLALLYQGVIYLFSRNWPHIWRYYQKNHQSKVLRVRLELVQKCEFDDGLYGLDFECLSLQIAIRHLSHFIPYDDDVNVRGDIYALRRAAKDLDDTITLYPIPGDERLRSKLKDLMSELYKNVFYEAEIIYGFKPCPEDYTEAELLKKGLSSWIESITDFQDKLRHLFRKSDNASNENNITDSINDESQTLLNIETETNTIPIDVISPDTNKVNMTISTTLEQNVVNLLGGLVVSSPISDLAPGPNQASQLVPAVTV